ncbi:MAG: hypothetical protein JW863_07200 [Chitinispirillaceae bacterium]|nr:hypothetical protein [Chitinispirillaceae bacterium]
MAVRFLLVLCMVFFSSCIQRNFVGKSKEHEMLSSITYSGGSGESVSEAVVINGAKNQHDGVAAEYHFIAQKHGQRGSAWYLIGQTVVREKNKIIDVVEIKLGSSSGQRIYYFDASDFLWNRK